VLCDQLAVAVLLLRRARIARGVKREDLNAFPLLAGRPDEPDAGVVALGEL
jgi:hypothetical protein